MTQRWGASPQDWAHFDLLLGLTEDLLPVVSNPHAEISALSKMKSLGKTPSIYNAQRKVAGLPDWTAKKTTADQIERWSKEGDYGICIQTRSIRAIDIDISDGDDARSVADFIRARLGGRSLPARQRANSGKCLLAFTLTDGEYGKRHFRTGTGLVEFLATGQQFVAVGTHPSGARYEWEGGLPDDFPVLTGPEFEELWRALVEQFAVGEASTSGAVARRSKDEGIAAQDSLYDWLAESGLVLDYGNEGQAFIECPWKDGHSSDSGVTETAYFPKGGRGYEQGHFKCLHASCAGRTDTDFEDAMGYRLACIEVLPALVEEHEPAPLPPLERRNDGRLLATLPNLRAALSRPDWFGWDVRFDTFYNNIMVAPFGTGEWRQVTDALEVRIRAELERNHGFQPVGKDLMRDALRLVADDQPFDTAQHWLGGLEWDGKRRVETFFTTYFGVEDSPYTRAVSRYIWTAMAGRVSEPGIKADMVPVLVGPQGAGKSTGVRAMVPDDSFFTEINLAERDADQSRMMRGKLIGEIGELRGFRRVEQEAIKAFISRTHEEWVEKYEARATVMARRLVFIGTNNHEEFLEDDTGNRRWLPMTVGKVDVEGITADRGQMWAEARDLFDLVGVDWQAEGLAAEVHERHTVKDSWQDVIRTWLDTADEVSGQAPADGVVKGTDVLRFALGFDPKQIKRGDEMRVAAALKALGMRQMVKRVDGEMVRGWVKG